jgi:hypothetical protein
MVARMIWSSRKRLGAKGLRCAVKVQERDGNEVTCGRPAKRYGVVYRGLQGEPVQMCKNHAALKVKAGFTIVLLGLKEPL